MSLEVHFLTFRAYFLCHALLLCLLGVVSAFLKARVFFFLRKYTKNTAVEKWKKATVCKSF